MFKASAGVMLPTSIIGSLPRPTWYTATLGSKPFLEAMVNSRYREQYEDAVSCFLRAQEMAGLDIVTDGDAHYDEEVGGMSWQSYPLTHMEGFSKEAHPSIYKVGAVAYPRGHILHDFLEARVFPKIVGPVGRGNLQYAAMWKVAQRMTNKPVKFGTILPELLAASCEDDYYKDPVERTWALSDALNAELNDLADAGCPVLQMEEPQIHMVPVRGKAFGKLDVGDLVKVFNNTVKGLREKTEVWCHTCWGNPSQQRIFKEPQSYQPTLEALNHVEADALTFETCSSGPGDLKAIGEVIKDKKVVIGVIDHHTLQIERPEEVAALIREALKHIPPERLIISSDCGMGREGMGRRHAAYKMVSMVLGTNIVRKELGLPEAQCLAAEGRYSLTMAAR
ncbi:cobalamin-independent methionine synthase II family protein [Pseudorhodoplanes sp.]|jgi:5-methyltetrahydropteroyltriglutamate--homocysteine methyltransferase|uniref:cobalamin-independent methionine synthase II family protein n=1 Tax=Pseudorhodoplanes sp. TaxID=1934341 RepID=UPI002B5B21C3|nr:cobalamin-independent methionine synthase II family protein [Pseudorhodoplanes sp.]HWV41961.1 cobalamin-independent methionine synthase II family protein [Pseudorhodoplanes sp.]